MGLSATASQIMAHRLSIYSIIHHATTPNHHPNHAAGYPDEAKGMPHARLRYGPEGMERCPKMRTAIALLTGANQNVGRDEK